MNDATPLTLPSAWAALHLSKLGVSRRMMRNAPSLSQGRHPELDSPEEFLCILFGLARTGLEPCPTRAQPVPVLRPTTARPVHGTNPFPEVPI